MEAVTATPHSLPLELNKAKRSYEIIVWINSTLFLGMCFNEDLYKSSKYTGKLVPRSVLNCYSINHFT